MRTLLAACAIALTLTPATLRAQKNDFDKLNEAISSHQDQNDSAALKQDLAQADALLAREPANPSAHWVRARALDALKQRGDAIVEYRRAGEAQVFASDAHYNIGVIFDGQGRDAEALLEYELAFKANPKNVDAAYNMAQMFYLQNRFAEALDKWTVAKSLSPDEFQVSRKLVQAYYALGRDAEALRARDEVLRIRALGKDKDVMKATDWVFDQIVLPKGRVYARESFSPDGAWKFEVDNAQGSVVGYLELAAELNSYVLRASGTPPVAVAARPYPRRPVWRELKSVVRDMALAAFPVTQ